MAGAKKKTQGALVANVYVDGELYLAGTEVPASVAKQITNPKAWADGDAPMADESTASAPAAPSAPDTGADTGNGATRPPEAGAGSGTDKWHAYAKATGVEVAEDADRDTVIAAVKAAEGSKES